MSLPQLPPGGFERLPAFIPFQRIIAVQFCAHLLALQRFAAALADRSKASVSDIIMPTGRTTIHVLWGLSVRRIDDRSCEFTNLVRSRTTDEFKAFLDRQGIPFDVFRAQRQPMSIAHNQGETHSLRPASSALRWGTESR
ncbi:hypothetical protein BN77_p10914 [Rhizobium mesoamericanum STM3625]|uniref:Uncharacterized protein n=1 Tax=Rhizobium mesoamericanum STM3625 TaxID=1211777 RepID=K0PWV5_9HYPH|nr:hypothetical protein BN77_p10914 [Rhizobium mesoamericanum STM3625]